MTTTQTATINIEVGYQDTRDPSGRWTRWTEQAAGHTYWTYAVPVERVYDIETIANAVFEADNAPFELTGLSGAIREQMIVAYEMTAERHHSLSVGDRVRVGEVEVICASFGWERVYH